MQHYNVTLTEAAAQSISSKRQKTTPPQSTEQRSPLDNVDSFTASTPVHHRKSPEGRVSPGQDERRPSLGQDERRPSSGHDERHPSVSPQQDDEDSPYDSEELSESEEEEEEEEVFQAKHVLKHSPRGVEDNEPSWLESTGSDVVSELELG